LALRQHDAIDLMKLNATWDTNAWNSFLSACHKCHDIKTLAKTRYALQAGMVDLSKKKMNTDKMIIWFIRLQKSVEDTMKLIIREKNPNPCDNPLKAHKNIEFKDKKSERDHELELFLKKSGY
jgi:hypothetical protein